MNEVDRKRVVWIVAWKVFLIVAPVIAILAVCCVGAVLAARAYDLPLASAMLPAGIAVVVLLQVYMRVTERRHKRQMAVMKKAMENLSPVPASEADYAWLDREALKTWTFHLGSVGFVKLMDYTVSTGAAEVSGMKLREPFSRLMVSHESNCFVEVSQACRRGERPTRMTCTLVTVYSSGDECRSTTGEVQRNEYTPELMKCYFAVQTGSASELLRMHLEQRDAVAREHGLTVVTDLSYDVYLAQVKRQMEKTNELMNRIIATASGN